MKLDDTTAMQLAIAASRRALAEGNRPYGAVLLSAAGELLFEAANRQETDADCTAHAEMVLVREAAKRLGAAALRDGTVFASGEPCAMCAGALFWAGVRRVVFGASNPLMAEVLGGELLPARCAATLAGATPPVRVEGSLLEQEAAEVLREAAHRA